MNEVGTTIKNENSSRARFDKKKFSSCCKLYVTTPKNRRIRLRCLKFCVPSLNLICPRNFTVLGLKYRNVYQIDPSSHVTICVVDDLILRIIVVSGRLRRKLNLKGWLRRMALFGRRFASSIIRR